MLNLNISKKTLESLADPVKFMIEDSDRNFIGSVKDNNFGINGSEENAMVCDPNISDFYLNFSGNFLKYFNQKGNVYTEAVMRRLIRKKDKTIYLVAKNVKSGREEFRIPYVLNSTGDKYKLK